MNSVVKNYVTVTPPLVHGIVHGATTPDPARPQVADRGTALRYGGYELAPADQLAVAAEDGGWGVQVELLPSRNLSIRPVTELSGESEAPGAFWKDHPITSSPCCSTGQPAQRGAALYRKENL